MSSQLLHLVDRSTSEDALDMISTLLRHAWPDAHQRIIVLGHRQTGELAQWAGIPREKITYIRSMGWADPTGWQGVRRLVRDESISHVFAWGVSGMIATEMARFSEKKIAVFASVPAPGKMRVVRGILRAKKKTSCCSPSQTAALDHDVACSASTATLPRPSTAWQIVATSDSLAHALASERLDRDCIRVIHPGIDAAAPAADRAQLRRELGLEPADRPVILLAGNGLAARHDHGLWSAAILQQLFLRTRVVVRERLRGTVAGEVDPGVERLMYALPESETVIVAPREKSWRELLAIADVLLATPNGPMETGSLRAAMAGGVPIVATPVDCMSELIADGQTGLLAANPAPRAVAARLEDLINDASLAARIISGARARLQADFPIARMVQAFQNF